MDFNEPVSHAKSCAAENASAARRNPKSQPSRWTFPARNGVQSWTTKDCIPFQIWDECDPSIESPTELMERPRPFMLGYFVRCPIPRDTFG